MVAKLVRIAIIILVIFSMVVIARTPVVAAGVSVSATPSVQTVAPGATFDVDIDVSTSVPNPGDKFCAILGPDQGTM